MVRLSAKKWNLTYRAILTLTVETHKGSGINDDLQLIISDPILLDGVIDRDIHSTINVGHFKFYNLNRATSSLINQESFVYIKDALGEVLNPSRIDVYAFYIGDGNARYNDIKAIDPTKLYDAKVTKEQIIKESGIDIDNLDNSLIFTGVITEANTYRDSGSTDVITEVMSDDRMIEMGLTESLIPAGADKKQTIIKLAKEGGYQRINIGEIKGEFKNLWLVEDKAYTIIDKITGGLAFIDLNTLNVLRNDETLADRFAYIELNSESGLLGTPRRTWGQLYGDIIFSPEIKLAMRVRLDSEIDARWNGEYKVLGLTHKFLIGGGAMNRATTSITLLTGPLVYVSSILLTDGDEDETPGLTSSVRGEQVSKLTVSGYDVYYVINYIKKHHIAPPGNITAEITWGQAIQQENCTGPQYPTPGEIENLIRVCKIVQSIRNKHFKNGTLTVTSGWRSRRNNANTKGSVSNSTHLRGYALDFRLSAYNGAQVSSFINRYYKGWSYFMKGNGGVHYDTCRRVTNKQGTTIQVPIAGWSDL